jgi:hypothetical protein
MHRSTFVRNEGLDSGLRSQVPCLRATRVEPDSNEITFGYYRFNVLAPIREIRSVVSDTFKELPKSAAPARWIVNDVVVGIDALSGRQRRGVVSIAPDYLMALADERLVVLKAVALPDQCQSEASHASDRDA